MDGRGAEFEGLKKKSTRKCNLFLVKRKSQTFKRTHICSRFPFTGVKEVNNLFLDNFSTKLVELGDIDIEVINLLLRLLFLILLTPRFYSHWMVKVHKW